MHIQIPKRIKKFHTKNISNTPKKVKALTYNNTLTPFPRSLKESLPEKKGLGLLAEGQPKWGQPGLQWEGVPESLGAATEKAVSCIPTKCTCEGVWTDRKASPDDLNTQAGS